MPVNLLNEKDLNDYLADIVYHGQEMEVFKSGDFKSMGFVEQNKDAIVRSMLLQWCKHRLRTHLTEDLPEHQVFLTPVQSNEPNLPTWATNCLAEGKPIHHFKAEKIPTKLTDHIGMIRDYLYSAAESYINKTLARVKDTNAKGKEKISPKLRIDYLKTQEAYDSFAKTLAEAQKWHDVMAEKAEQKQRNEKLYQASLSGTKSVMKMANGMEMVQLTTPKALDYESEYMGHCVGSGGYDKDVKQGTIKIYSLRDADGMPHATFEIYVNDETGKEEIHQCKGKGNKAPVDKYRPYIQEFVKANNFDIVGDAKNIGLVRLYDAETQKSQYYDIFDLPKGKKLICKGDLDLSDMKLTELPDLSDIKVEGDFNCSENELTSLKGAPQAVDGNFDCHVNQLVSLDGAPQKVGGSFSCSYNQLTSLKGAPQEVGIGFYCCRNQLTSLEYAPQIIKDNLFCSYNRLTSLKGAPQKILGHLNCKYNQITSLEYAPQEIGGYLDCSGNQLTSLEYMPNIGGSFDCSNNKLTSLENMQKEIKGSFNCSHNQLTSLKGAPQLVEQDFDCSDNMLTSLEGAPQTVGDSYNCANNKLLSLQYAPAHIKENFLCSFNQLTSLKGAPQEVGRAFRCDQNNLTSLEGAPQSVGSDFNCRFNRLITLRGAPPTIDGDFDCDGNRLTSLKYIPICRYLHSDIDEIYDPDINECEFERSLSYKELEKSPRFKKEKREVSDERRDAIIYKIKRKIAAQNVSATKGEIKPKRTGKDKAAAKIKFMLARLKQKTNSK